MGGLAVYQQLLRATDRAFTAAVRRDFAALGPRSRLCLPIRLAGTERISIGHDVMFGAGCWLQTISGGELIIGDGVLGQQLSPAEAVAQAHTKDLEVQEKHGVKYLHYWYDEDTGKVFCLSEGPNKAAVEAVHREAHGGVADEIVEVKEGA